MSSFLNGLKSVLDFIAYAGGVIAFVLGILFVIAFIFDKGEERDDDE